MLAHPTEVYFGVFGGARVEQVRTALGAVYRTYDANVVPALRGLLARSGREPRTELRTATDDGVGAIATALTAQTEGLALRRLVQPEAVDQDALWQDAAVALVTGMTVPV